MDKKIWLIGGTSESAAIARAIASSACVCVITVTTPRAIDLYPDSEYLSVQVRKMSLEEMKLFCQQEQIKMIIDASHPFAVEVSRQAMATAQQLKIPYWRYERKNLDNFPENQYIISIKSFEELLNSNYLDNQRVLLTIGIRHLPLFKPYQDKALLFARILPTQEALEVALKSGFTSERIMALRPPISLALEKALWQQWQISLVISKASGKAGGEEIKRQLAQELQIKLIMIERPPLDYADRIIDIQDLPFLLQSPP